VADLKVGVCGEHGGDPRSVEFFHRAGLNYVSCSPYRVPVARLAAAHAALNDRPRADAAPAPVPAAEPEPLAAD
jgi:pyruvate,orthophosphate dikinase